MYLARFEGSGGVWLQAMVELTPPAGSQPAAAVVAAETKATLARLARVLAGLQGVHVAFRAVLDPSGRVERQVRVFGPDNKEAVLRRAVGSFLALERIGGNACTLPLNRAQYEDMVGSFPARAAAVALPRQQTRNGAWMTAGFRLAPVLSALVEDASAMGFGFAYQAQISPWHADAEDLRKARYNLLDLRQAPALPPSLLAEQERLLAAYQRATRIVREVVAVDDAQAEDWLNGVVQNQFRSAFGATQLGGPVLEYGTLGDLDLSIHPAAILQTLEGVDIDEVCREAADDSIFAQVMEWQPPAVFATATATDTGDTGDGDDGAPGAGDLPGPLDPSGPYLFLSYAHKDVGQIVPMLAQIESAGVPYWYDKHLVGGVEWDAELEERIRRSRLLLACISQSAVESKYCRREIKFADALNLPILTVMLSRSELRHGLAMLLPQYQMLDGAAADFAPQLKRALGAAFASSEAVLQ